MAPPWACATLAHNTSLVQAQLCCRVWYKYVASNANPNDAPSRGDMSYVGWDLHGMRLAAPFLWFAFDSTFTACGLGVCAVIAACALSALLIVTTY